jgi:hypothetical protein
MLYEKEYDVTSLLPRLVFLSKYIYGISIEMILAIAPYSKPSLLFKYDVYPIITGIKTNKNDKEYIEAIKLLVSCCCADDIIPK